MKDESIAQALVSDFSRQSNKDSDEMTAAILMLKKTASDPLGTTKNKVLK